MMTTQSMTKEASSVLCLIKQNPITVLELTRLTVLSESYCDLVLTQMEMAGLVAKEEGRFIRCHLGIYLCEVGDWKGVSATSQPSAHNADNKQTKAHRFCAKA